MALNIIVLMPSSRENTLDLTSMPEQPWSFKPSNMGLDVALQIPPLAFTLVASVVSLAPVAI